MNKWDSSSHNKYLLQYHLIFVCKYRKQLLKNNDVSDYIKFLLKEICKRHSVNIKYMETDKDHIHYMIETRANISLSNFVRSMKSYISFHAWGNIHYIYQKVFGKKRLFGLMDILYAQLAMSVSKR